jgi:hypothetical protein
MTSQQTRKQKPTKASAARDGVIEQLRSYAQRGVFREFAVKPQTAERVEFRFVWLTPKPVRAKFDAKSNLFTVIDLLPDILPRSEMDRALRAFVDGRFSTKLPAHRRISRSLVRKLTCVNRRRAVSIRLTLGTRDPAEGARQAILLISEIFQNFLAGPYHEYMVRNFDLRED